MDVTTFLFHVEQIWDTGFEGVALKADTRLPILERAHDLPEFTLGQALWALDERTSNSQNLVE